MIKHIDMDEARKIHRKHLSPLDPNGPLSVAAILAAMEPTKYEIHLISSPHTECAICGKAKGFVLVHSKQPDYSVCLDCFGIDGIAAEALQRGPGGHVDYITYLPFAFNKVAWQAFFDEIGSLADA